MKKPSIYPLGDQIMLKIKQASLGALDTSSMKTGVEWGVVEALGPDVEIGRLHIGDKVFVKSWGVDVISYENKDYYFVSEAREAIVAIIK